MKSFKQFIGEAYFDPNVQGRSQVQRVGSDGSKIGAERKKLVLSDQDLLESNNQQRKEVLLSYHLESNKRKQEQKD
jgi:hypothetical protein